MTAEEQLDAAIDATIRHVVKQTMQDIESAFSGVDFDGTTYYGTAPANAFRGDSGGILSGNECILTKKINK